mgnify:FL=1|jgi:hypothetical protein
MIDITRKDLSKQYPVYTKAGNIWKNRIDWNSILKPGTVISTHFGIFTFVNTHKENKVWYIILSDGVNNYTVKRQQARNNKKLPKSAITQKVVYLARIDLVDSLLAQAKKYINEYNAEHTEDYVPWGKVGVPEEYLVNILQEKIGTILSVAYINESLFNKFKRQLINYYHPDSGNVQDSTVLTMIADELQTIKITKGVL